MDNQDKTKSTQQSFFKSKRFEVSIISLIIIIFMAGLAYFITRTKTSTPILTYIDPKLSQQEKNPFQNEINDLQGKVQGASKEDQYRDYLKIGADYVAIGELAKARDAYTNASNLFPDNSVPWGELARVSFQMTDYSAAMDYVNKALQLNPTSVDLQNLQKQINQALSK